MKSKLTLEKFAILVKQCFDELSEKINIVSDGLKILRDEMKHDFNIIGHRLNHLEQGQENIILRLDSKANKIDVEQQLKNLKREILKKKTA